MLRPVEITEIPEGLHLTAWSTEEIMGTSREAKAALVSVSPGVWRVENEAGETLLIVGVMLPYLIGGTPELWLLVCEAMKRGLRRNLLECRVQVRELIRRYPNLTVQIDAAYPAGQRFARFMGFWPRTTYTIHKGREYITYEVRNWQ